MVASVLTSEAGDGDLRGVYGPHGGQQAFLRVREAWEEMDPAALWGAQRGVTEEGRESGTGWS